MPMITPVSNFDTKNKNNTSSKKYVYPMSYKQFVTNSSIKNLAGSLILGSIAGVSMHLAQLPKKTSLIGGSVAGGSVFLYNMILGLNGKYETKYLRRKQHFENQDYRLSLSA